jgi:hypothetical protein
MAASYLTKGSIQDNGLTTLNLTLEDGTAYTNAKSITKNVLSATASLFNDSWRDEVPGNYLSADFTYYDSRNDRYVDVSAETFTGDDIVNPYLSGNAGIWRSYKAYTYVGKRKSSALFAYNTTDVDPKLYDDGVFEEAVPLFNWELGLPEEFTGGGSGANTYKNWEWMSEITRFNTDNYETENVNRLGIYSSALYGYGNSLSIGVGGNASLHEIGVMDFETLSGTVPFGQTIKQNGLNFYNNTASAPKKVIITEQQSFSKAVYSGGNLDLYFKFKTAAEATEFQALFGNITSGSGWPQTYENYQPKSNNLENTFGLSLVSKVSSGKKGNQSTFLNGKFTTMSSISSTEVKCSFKPYVCTPQDVKPYLPENSYYYGKLTMLKKRSVANLNGDIVAGTSFIANGTDGMKAHSGKKMMKVNGSLMFEQQKFCFTKNKSYILSLWVSRTAQDVKTYQGSTLVEPIMVKDDQTYYVIPSVRTYGKVVEGWQKVDIEFKNDGTYDDHVFAVRFNTGGVPLYVDDVRLSPKTGGMKTFVYDPLTFWLKASLNVDNYATFYHYDEQGNLSLTKQETEKGIFSVSENRSRMRK